ncbi:MAG: hypothetical protein H6650_19105 [Ardenticatenales bacterium]|nr:hypothetical protein [Ardenticatenales bacterium]
MLFQQSFPKDKRTIGAIIVVTLMLALLISYSFQTAAAQPAMGALAQSEDCLPAITVTSAADSGPGTLRQALVDVCDEGEIDFDLPQPATITLTSGELVITRTMTIQGPGASMLGISGNNASRVFNVSGSGVAIRGLTIRDGHISGDGGGIYNTGSLSVQDSVIFSHYSGHDGGGVMNDGGTLFIIATLIRDNMAHGGAGIFTAHGTTVVSHARVLSNISNDDGGGVTNDGGRVIINNSTISGNITSDLGGGVHNRGDTPIMLLSQCALTNNHAGGKGGGISNEEADLILVFNTTVSGNVTSLGGGIYNRVGLIYLQGSTITANQASTGGGVNSYVHAQSQVYVNNSIIANNLAGEQCVGAPLISLGYNLSGDGSCNLTGPGDLPNTDPLLGPLQDNGGPTLTHALLSGSLAIDAGNNDTCLPTDQRGIPRPQGPACDIGAYEVEVTPP